eukprot:298231-Hanusia_phi.AAC.1
MFRGSRDSEAKDWGGKMGGSFRQRQGDTAQAPPLRGNDVQSRLSTVAKLYTGGSDRTHTGRRH